MKETGRVATELMGKLTVKPPIAPGLDARRLATNQPETQHRTLNCTGGFLLIEADSVITNAQHSSARHAFPVAGLLAGVGGFLDAFTYFGHGRVFANAMTGNVVLLGAFAAAGNWVQSLRHALPIFAFLLGVATAQLPQLPRIRKLIPDPALASLAIEVVFLFGAGWYPQRYPDLALLLGISFLAALQSSSFRYLQKWPYSSTMTTGNLRHFAEAGFKAIFQGPDREMVQQAKLFGAICLAFLAGAIAGAFCVSQMHNKALWAAEMPLLIAAVPLVVERRRARAENA